MKYNERLNKFKELVDKGYYREQILLEMGISRKTILNYEKKLNIKIKNKTRIPNFNSSYFKNVDNEYKAYILGFIFADGYIEANERSLTFNINKKDIDILNKIKKCMSSSGKIKKSSTKNCVRLHFCSIELVNDLRKYGVVKNKTKILKFPNIREDLYRHFLRGYFDGDGHIGKRQCALVIGSEYMFRDIISFLNKKFDTELHYSNKGSYYVINFNRCNCNIVKWMYENSNIYLDRKYKTFIENWSNYKETIRSRG